MWPGHSRLFSIDRESRGRNYRSEKFSTATVLLLAIRNLCTEGVNIGKKARIKAFSPLVFSFDRTNHNERFMRVFQHEALHAKPSSRRRRWGCSRI